ncbi:MAG TPA: 2-oxo acid dehydrogenase subunit E2 [Gemmatimonadetes bacterium]|nr:2-oxo acid dehydrogenase subunit E2 [Gemmatimonadota bacterium]HIC63413.1 2-oxo acid dehydrogenase subunit E2 [Gemmatimonadota bacterium]
MARIEVPMPQMGESIAEGTVSKWLKQVGDTVERDEPILEISTDKVDAEIPAPSAGILVEVGVEEGETVEVGTVLALIDPEGIALVDTTPDKTLEPDLVAPSLAATQTLDVSQSAEERLRTRSTPVVRKIAAEHGIDLTNIVGSGHAGRVTKQDIVAFMESSGATGADPPTISAARARDGVPIQSEPSSLWDSFYKEVQHPEYPVRPADQVEGMDKMRRLTAEHMVIAKRIAPHVHSFIEIDFSVIDRIRTLSRSRWEAQNARVSYTSFVAWAVSRVLRDFPMVNSVVSGNNVIYRGNVNLGMAVDLDPGLIVPVVHDADHLGLVGIGNKIVDLAGRARARKLMPDEIQGATFTITNPGVLGTVVGLPVIPKGTSAILGIGSIEKRVAVVTDQQTEMDVVAIRKRSLFSLGYDHRIVDGADAARFLSALKEMLESFPEDA